MRALVTGAAGFVGQWMTRALVEAGHDVIGAGMGEPPSASETHPSAFVHADFRNAADVAAVVDAARPDLVIHLAGIAFLPAAAADAGATFDVNVSGTARLLGVLQARRAAGVLDPTVLVVGSAEQYGRHDATAMPLAESAAQLPLSVYAASKVAQEAVAMQTVRSEGLRVVCTRSFNHSGPGQAAHFLLPALVGRAVALRTNGARTLRLGNATPVRDYLHVWDVVRAYLALTEHGVAGEAYNVCSGTGWAVQQVAERILERLGVDGEVVSDPALARVTDVPILVGDNARLRLATEWAPTRGLDDIIDDLIHAATH